MSVAIRRMYKRAGVASPNGKGLHTKVAHSCVIAYLKKGFSKGEAWQRCQGALGKKALKKRKR